MKSFSVSILVATALTVLPTAATAEMKHVSDSELLKNLEGAAPPDILAKATVLNMAPDGTMKTVRQGTNGWTCMDPGNAPMCADPGGFEWAKAYSSKSAEPQALGFIYMLRGDNGASNTDTDPHATGPTADNNWIKTGPHVMIVGAAGKSMMQGYPREAKADPKTPYVMWPGTPYEHLMLPLD